MNVSLITETDRQYKKIKQNNTHLITLVFLKLKAKYVNNHLLILILIMVKYKYINKIILVLII